MNHHTSPTVHWQYKMSEGSADWWVMSVYEAVRPEPEQVPSWMSVCECQVQSVWRCCDPAPVQAAVLSWGPGNSQSDLCFIAHSSVFVKVFGHSIHRAIHIQNRTSSEEEVCSCRLQTLTQQLISWVNCVLADCSTAALQCSSCSSWSDDEYQNFGSKPSTVM